MYFVYTNFFGEESGCDQYASKFSCSYLLEKASYDVYYWHNLSNNDDNDEKLIGHTTGLLNCKNYAVNYASSIHEDWNDRAYICMLVKDGANLEKHRYIHESVTSSSFSLRDLINSLGKVDQTAKLNEFQNDKKLSIQVASINSVKVQDKPPNSDFFNKPESEVWLKDMSGRLANRIPDKDFRENFLITLHYEANRSGLDPQMVLAFIEVASNFEKYEVSKNGIKGYMQVNPVWIERIGNSDHNLFLLRTNLRYGTTILRLNRSGF